MCDVWRASCLLTGLTFRVRRFDRLESHEGLARLIGPGNWERHFEGGDTDGYSDQEERQQKQQGEKED